MAHNETPAGVWPPIGHDAHGSIPQDAIWVGRVGVADSGIRLNEGATEADAQAFLAALNRSGKARWEVATLGERYGRTVRCPVNGDGYRYTRRAVVVGETVVASFEVYPSESEEI